MLVWRGYSCPRTLPLYDRGRPSNKKAPPRQGIFQSQTPHYGFALTCRSNATPMHATEIGRINRGLPNKFNTNANTAPGKRSIISSQSTIASDAYASDRSVARLRQPIGSSPAGAK